MYKFQQVLHTVGEHKSVDGAVIPDGTRVVVMDKLPSNPVRLKVHDIRYGSLFGQRVVLESDSLLVTKRGRKKKGS